MYTITYNLKNEEDTSAVFYEQLKQYSNDVYQELDELFYDPLLAYFRFLYHDGGTIYSHAEGYLELLSIGVFWCVYSGDALASGPSTNDFLQKLADIRESNKHLKPIVDAFRGICLTAMMSPDLYDHMGIAPPTRANFSALLDWLEATGEFKQEVNRLKPWERYLESLTNEAATDLLESILSTGLWFEKDSIEGLGDYTEQVDRYLNELRPKRYWKEDVIFCGRRRVEYHLNMVGAEWLNTAYRKTFLEKQHKLVLIPTCMRLLQKEDCQARPVGEWFQCAQCHSDCQVFQLSKMEADLGFKLYMVPHSSTVKEFPISLDLTQTGIVGVSCVLNLISGGWMLAQLGIPAQCVLLDYSGCKTHWHHEGIPTAINAQRLMTILTD